MAQQLNPPQRAAVETLSGPLLVLAGAGTGKTRVVTYRIARLIRGGIRPNRILAVTFTNKAAGEMQQRAAELLGKRLREKPEISTFHSLCVRVLKRHITHLGYPAKFAIYDRGDQESLARQVLREIRCAESALRPGDLLYLISRWKSASLRPAEAAAAAQTDKEHLAATAYRRYQKAIKLAGAVDFDDLLGCTEELFERFPGVRREEAARFDHVLVDEYQDTNGAQYRIITALAAPHRNLCVVGDDDQSIYGWRGAEISHILRFHHDWPDAKVVRLEDNYRCTAPILEMANRLIAFNRHRHPKQLRSTKDGPTPRVMQFPDETKEAVEVVGEIARLIEEQQLQPRHFAILCRTNEQPRPFEMELRRNRLPYVLLGGQSFYDRKEVRDVLSYLKLLANPRDEVPLLRIINTPARGIGQRAVERMLADAVASGRPLWDVMQAAESVPGLTPPARKGIAELVDMVQVFGGRAATQSPPQLIRQLIEVVGYRQELERLYPDGNELQARWNAVEEVVNAAASHAQRKKDATLATFLEDVALGGRDDQREDDKQLNRNAVMLMTLHSAKGLEFPHVYLVGMEEGLLPHHRSVAADNAAIEEERRLCYVGMTRAQDALTMTLALNRNKWGKPRPTIPSRFLYELLGKADNPQEALAAARRSGAQRGAVSTRR